MMIATCLFALLLPSMPAQQAPASQPVGTAYHIETRFSKRARAD